MNARFLGIYLISPVIVILVIAFISGYFKKNRKKSIRNELYTTFIKCWKDGEKADEPDDSFFKRFLKIFKQAYEYEESEESVNKRKFYFYKLLVLYLLVSVPFLTLYLITRKELILGENEWNDIYLYTVVLIPLICAYLVNKFLKIRQYHDIWSLHLENRHYLEWRMLVFIKDYELLKAGMPAGESDSSPESLKTGFINDMCEYWKTATDENKEVIGTGDESLFEEIGALFNRD